MSDTPTTEGLAVKRTDAPEYYIRVNIAKNSKGYTHETTVSMRWNDVIYPDKDGQPTNLFVRTPDAWGTTKFDEPADSVLRSLLQMADTEARAEIARRELMDAEVLA